MKNEIIKIAQDLEQGTITETEAQNHALNKGAVMPRFSVSLVYTKLINGTIDILLRVMIVSVSCEYEAFGKAFYNFIPETKDYTLSGKVVLFINEA